MGAGTQETLIAITGNAMQHDLMTRRQALQTALGLGAGAVLLGGPSLLGGAPIDDALAATACTLTPEQEEGPFYVALEQVRSNIVGGRTGVKLQLRVTVIDSSTCKPISGAAVDIWQADAIGQYSDESQQGTVGQTWLRGVQLTNTAGLARFTTIYPGFYQGRAPHIHAKVHIGGGAAGSKYSGGHVSHTGQMFFPEAISSKVYKTRPYLADPNTRTYTATDHVYTEQGGARSVLKLTGVVGTGLLGAITLAVDTSASR
jgi:protocatechuate 3,4-dioxygenase beta subunit